MLGVAAEGIFPDLGFLGGEKALSPLLPKQADIGIIVTRLKTNGALKRHGTKCPQPMIMRPATKQDTTIELFNTIAPYRVTAEKRKV